MPFTGCLFCNHIGCRNAVCRDNYKDLQTAIMLGKRKQNAMNKWAESTNFGRDNTMKTRRLWDQYIKARLQWDRLRKQIFDKFPDKRKMRLTEDGAVLLEGKIVWKP